jgi:hypothetical protein
MSSDTPPSDRADEILLAGRLRRRESARGRAPAWFRGGELDLLEPVDERGRVFNQARVEVRKSGWPLAVMLVTNGLFLPSLMFCVRKEFFHPAMALAVVYVSLLLLLPWLWRTTLRRVARRTLRDSPDWPLRDRARFSQPT